MNGLSHLDVSHLELLFFITISCLCLQEIVHIEILCKQLYETTDTNVRNEAEKSLIRFASSPDCLNKCQVLLERKNVSSYLTTTYINSIFCYVHVFLDTFICSHRMRSFQRQQLLPSLSAKPVRFFLKTSELT